MPTRDHTLPNGNAIDQQDSDYLLLGSPDSAWSTSYSDILDVFTNSDFTLTFAGFFESDGQPGADQIYFTDSDDPKTLHLMTFAGGGGGVDQDLYDSATSEITSLRALLDSANTELAGGGSTPTQVQRWIT